MATQARMRAPIKLRENPSIKAGSSEILGPSTPIQILEDQNEWLKVKASRMSGAIEGWAPREALAFHATAQAVFPDVSIRSGEAFPSVPPSLKAADFLNWLAAPAPPNWISSTVWSALQAESQQNIMNGIRNAVQERQAQWDLWLANVSANGRQNEARMEEWLVTLQGGMDVWSLRGERIFKEAGEGGGHLGWAVENDIMRWTGQVKRNDNEPKYKIWHEVWLYKMEKLLRGWYKADLLDPYVYPTDEDDPSVASNLESQFDLSQPLLRLPVDREFQDAIDAGRRGYQYLDVFRVIDKHVIHFNLCGEICVAALTGRDVIPLLNQWKNSYVRAPAIIRDPKEGTSVGDLKSMLALSNFVFEEYRYSPSVALTSPLRLQKQLMEGKMAIAGVGIYRSNGKLCGNETDSGKIARHWVILEDIKPVGNSGWVRLYNPFRNREEICSYNIFIQSVGHFGVGLWVTIPGG